MILCYAAYWKHNSCIALWNYYLLQFLDPDLDLSSSFSWWASLRDTMFCSKVLTPEMTVGRAELIWRIIYLSKCCILRDATSDAKLCWIHPRCLPHVPRGRGVHLGGSGEHESRDDRQDQLAWYGNAVPSHSSPFLRFLMLIRIFRWWLGYNFDIMIHWWKVVFSNISLF